MKPIRVLLTVTALILFGSVSMQAQDAPGTPEPANSNQAIEPGTPREGEPVVRDLLDDIREDLVQLRTRSSNS